MTLTDLLDEISRILNFSHRWLGSFLTKKSASNLTKMKSMLKSKTQLTKPEHGRCRQGQWRMKDHRRQLFLQR